MQQFTVDINADVGEGVGNEKLLMPYVSSCNIACGGHAGTNETMRTVITLAKQYGVKIGAHPSFPDIENFGRQKMDISCAALFSSLKGQVQNLTDILYEEQLNLHHIKPHGALYNLAAVDEKIAQVILELMKTFILPIKLYVPYKSIIADLAIKNHIPIVYEAFADRNYNDDLTLVSRNKNNALIDNEAILFEHVFRMITEQKVKSISGAEISILVQTICVHGDNPEAINLLKKLNKNLVENNIEIK